MDENYYAKIIWEYMCTYDTLSTADLVLLCGNDDDRTAVYTAELYKKGLAPLVLVSGSGSAKNKEGYMTNEAKRLASVMIEKGIPEQSILVEEQATNSGENVVFSQQLLKEKSVKVESIILVHKLYMTRRARATFLKQWTGPEYQVTSMPISYDEYKNGYGDDTNFLNFLVGDFLRMREYAKLGFQIEEEIPSNVWDAGQKLVEMGYTKYVV